MIQIDNIMFQTLI